MNSAWEGPTSSESAPVSVLARREAAARSADALRLSVAGLSAAELDILQSILAVLEDRTERRWRLCDEPQADLYLHTREASLPTRGGEVTGLILHEGEAAGGPDQLSLILPLRVMSVLDTLNAAQDRLNQRSHAPPPVDDALVHPADDGRSLASALARLAARRIEQNLRARIVGHGTLYLCPIRRVYCADFPYEGLSAALEQHRYVMTALAHDATELAAQLPYARPIDEVMWRIGLLTAWERADKDRFRFQLRRWPDLARLPHRAEHIQLCAMLAARPQSVDELVAATGMAPNDATHLMHACDACGLLQGVEVDAAAQSTPSPAPVAPSGLGGLFERLRRRLGF